jgi:hypothetical protein
MRGESLEDATAASRSVAFAVVCPSGGILLWQLRRRARCPADPPRRSSASGRSRTRVPHLKCRQIGDQHVGDEAGDHDRNRAEAQAVDDPQGETQIHGREVDQREVAGRPAPVRAHGLGNETARGQRACCHADHRDESRVMPDRRRRHAAAPLASQRLGATSQATPLSAKPVRELPSESTPAPNSAIWL